MVNNYLSLNNNSFNYSSQLTGYEASNIYDDFRSSLWITTGQFEITSSNMNLYFNASGAKTATIAVGSYTTPALLAAAIQAAMNAVSSGFTVSYDSAGETYKFTIASTDIHYSIFV